MPLGLFLIVILYSFIALTSFIFTGAILLTIFQSEIWAGGMIFPLTAFAIYSPLCLFAAIGLFKGSLRARKLAMFLSLIGILSGILSATYQKNFKPFFILVVSVFVLWYLLRPRVSEYFAGQQSRA